MTCWIYIYIEILYYVLYITEIVLGESEWKKGRGLPLTARRGTCHCVLLWDI